MSAKGRNSVWAKRRVGETACGRVGRGAISGAMRLSREAATHNSLGRSPRDPLVNDLALKARDKFGQVTSDTAQSTKRVHISSRFQR